MKYLKSIYRVYTDLTFDNFKNFDLITHENHNYFFKNGIIYHSAVLARLSYLDLTKLTQKYENLIISHREISANKVQYIKIQDKKGFTIIVFRGTDNCENWKLNTRLGDSLMSFIKNRFKYWLITFIFSICISFLFGGFSLNVFFSCELIFVFLYLSHHFLCNKNLNLIHEGYSDFVDIDFDFEFLSDEKYFLIGHSLGGAIVEAIILKNQNKKIKGITFNKSFYLVDYIMNGARENSIDCRLENDGLSLLTFLLIAPVQNLRTIKIPFKFLSFNSAYILILVFLLILSVLAYNINYVSNFLLACLIIYILLFIFHFFVSLYLNHGMKNLIGYLKNKEG